MTSDDDVRRWWCERLGWEPRQIHDGCINVSRLDGDYSMSDAELSEAVKSYLLGLLESDDGWDLTVNSDALARALCSSNPMASLRAVREVVDE